MLFYFFNMVKKTLEGKIHHEEWQYKRKWYYEVNEPLTRAFKNHGVVDTYHATSSYYGIHYYLMHRGFEKAGREEA